jgi:hypothetical protein
MGRRCAFKENDVVRAIKAARKAGLEVTGIEYGYVAGELVKFVTNTGKPAEAALESNDLDHWIAKHAREIEGH